MIRTIRIQSLWSVVFCAAVAWPQFAWGQFPGTNDPANVAGQTALENSGAGSVGLRRPGEMVNSGVARATAHIVHPQIGVDIQVTEKPPTIGDVFFPEAISIIFDNLNQLITLFENAIRARAGQPPVMPPTPTVPDRPDESDDDASMMEEVDQDSGSGDEADDGATNDDGFIIDDGLRPL